MTCTFHLNQIAKPHWKVLFKGFMMHYSDFKSIYLFSTYPDNTVKMTLFWTQNGYCGTHRLVYTHPKKPIAKSHLNALVKGITMDHFDFKSNKPFLRFPHKTVKMTSYWTSDCLFPDAPLGVHIRLRTDCKANFESPKNVLYDGLSG